MIYFILFPCFLVLILCSSFTISGQVISVSSTTTETTCDPVPFKDETTAIDELSLFGTQLYGNASKLCKRIGGKSCKINQLINRAAKCMNQKNVTHLALILQSEDLFKNIPRPVTEQDARPPVKLDVQFKVQNVDSVNTVKMDFYMDFTLRVSWKVFGAYAHQYRTLLCVNRDIDITQKKVSFNTQQDMSLFWVPDVLIWNAKSSDSESRLISTQKLEVETLPNTKDNNSYQAVKMTYVEKGWTLKLVDLKCVAINHFFFGCVQL